MTTATDPEYCPSPTGDHKHSESWYDCLPCTLCGDDSVPFACDCGRPSHGPGGAALATPLKVRIDVFDNNDLVEEAAAAGCVAVLESTRSGRYQYVITGPKDLLNPLLHTWGYEDEGDGYEILTPEVTQ